MKIQSTVILRHFKPVDFLTCWSDLVGSGGEDEQTDSMSRQTKCRAQTDGTGAFLSVGVCLPDQRLAVDA